MIILNPKKKKVILCAVFLALIIVLIGGFADNALAGDTNAGSASGGGIFGWLGNQMFMALAWVAYGIVYFIGLIFLFLTKILVSIAQYNDFVNVRTVEIGWKIVRDFCNMFFILALLIIAFATILRYENYHVKKLLPKLLIMAVLINFSKTICGLFIDFSQVIMLTFVKSFAGIGQNNLVHLLGMDKMISMAQASETGPLTEPLSSMQIFAGLLAAIAASAIAVVILIAFICILLIRVVMLWVYVILSPIAFLTSALPAGQKYSTQWWGEFSRQLVVGPVLAFFLWLALATAGETANTMNAQVQGMSGEGPFKSAIISDILVESTFHTYIITVALLIGGLIVTQQAGGAAASIAGNAVGKIKAGGKWTGRKTLSGARSTGRLGLATAKGVDAMYLNNNVSKAANVAKSRLKSGLAGGALGVQVGSLAGPAGIAGGGIAGFVAGVYGGEKYLKRREEKIKRRKELMAGKVTDKEGNTYKQHGDKFYKFDEAGGHFVDQNNKMVNSNDLNDKGVSHNNLAPMSDQAKNFYAAYDSIKSPASAAQAAVVDEKVSKLEANYKAFDTETLNRLVKIEQDSAKKMAAAITLATKRGFKDGGEVNEAKKAFSGNPISAARFEDIMNKRDAFKNNTIDGKTLNENKLAKLFSSGKANFGDQDPGSMNADSFRLMAKLSEDRFEKHLDSMAKTGNDKAAIAKTLGEAVEKGIDKSKKEDLAIRKAYAVNSGEFNKAYKGDGAGLKQDLRAMSTIDFANVKKSDAKKGTEFGNAFSEAMDVGMLRNISKSDKIDRDLKDSYMELAASNDKLRVAMKNDRELNVYIKEDSEKS